MVIFINGQNLSLNEKMSVYSRTLTDCMNMEAIFSDETENFVAPYCPRSGEPVRIRLRAAKDNLERAFIVIDGNVEKMNKEFSSSDIFDYYFFTVPGLTATVSYYFKVEKNRKCYFYNKRGLYPDVDEKYNFRVIPDFSVPEWAKGAVIYQIFVDRFFNGDETNDVVENEYAYLGQAAKAVKQWDEPPKETDIANFYGGDLKGVIDKMDYLKDLGVEAIYFCPIFVSPSNHKYDTQDYDHIDPHYGKIIKDGGEPLSRDKFSNRYATKYTLRTTDKANLDASDSLFCDLVKIAHKNGVKIILDGVFNHCGAFNKWMDKENFYSGKKNHPNGAYLDKNSPYHGYFQWYDSDWPNNDCYDSWWNFDNHPKLNYENSALLRDYILGVAKKWVSPPFDADGWRLDVAADLGYSKEFNHRFWKDFRAAVKRAKPDALILSEHYGDPEDWLQGDQWDTVMNYDAFMEPVTWFFTGMEKHSDAFKDEALRNSSSFESAIRYHMSRFPAPSLQTAMNELSNHDHSRFLTRTNMRASRLGPSSSEDASADINKAVMMEAVMLQMTWPGAPTVYYGDEAGLTGWTDPDNRRSYPWGNEDKTLIAFHKAMISIRKKYRALKTGSLEFLFCDFGVITFGRWDNERKIVVALNNNDSARALSIPVWKACVPKNRVMKRVIMSRDKDFSLEPAYFQAKDGFLDVEADAFSGMVFVDEEPA
ncbi:MAG: glycoside hydrolase family 13 protein [Clostridiales bacterium]|jgi:alpha-glucosidase|nr:glycoside hydrolase family 13 protein [Clostridiales bacterium]